MPSPNRPRQVYATCGWISFTTSWLQQEYDQDYKTWKMKHMQAEQQISFAMKEFKLQCAILRTQTHTCTHISNSFPLIKWMGHYCAWGNTSQMEPHGKGPIPNTSLAWRVPYWQAGAYVHPCLKQSLELVSIMLAKALTPAIVIQIR